MMLKESELDEKFESVFSSLLNDENQQNELSKNIKSLALPNATQQIVNEIVKLMND
jgi:UDP-N-acetylglucosamine--N-acetylmuramyl-(pentapeptide) pyrophosphoryl-undecaprenol N-acetylglucosamine transferase